VPTPKPRRTIHPLQLTIESIREAFLKEDCELTTTTYGNSTSRLDYKFGGKDYHVQCYSWFSKGSRPHLPRAPREGPTSHKKKSNRTNITELFQREGCEFVAPDEWIYESNQQPLTYRYQGKEYTTTINRFVQFNHRPHLGKSKQSAIPADIAAALKTAECEFVSWDKKTQALTFKHKGTQIDTTMQELLTMGVCVVMALETEPSADPPTGSD
jgi:hypothetical protein